MHLKTRRNTTYDAVNHSKFITITFKVIIYHGRLNVLSLILNVYTVNTWSQIKIKHDYVNIAEIEQLNLTEIYDRLHPHYKNVLSLGINAEFSNWWKNSNKQKREILLNAVRKIIKYSVWKTNETSKAKLMHYVWRLEITSYILFLDNLRP